MENEYHFMAVFSEVKKNVSNKKYYDTTKYIFF